MPYTPPPKDPNFNPGNGSRLAVDRFDFEAHLEGTNPPVANAPLQNFRHTASQIDLHPSLVINGITYTDVQDALAALNAIVGPVVVSPATTTTLGIVQLAGDLQGSGTTATSPKVSGLQGFPINVLPPSPGNVLTWNGTAWGPAPSVSNITFGNDLVSSNTLHQWVSGISGASGTAGTVTLGDAVHNLTLRQFTSTQLTPPSLTISSSLGFSTSGTAGSGGGMTLNTGAGGNGTQGATGGTLTINSGNGGSSSAFGLNGGFGGAIHITSGAGGDAPTGTGGDAGSIIFTAGAGSQNGVDPGHNGLISFNVGDLGTPEFVIDFGGIILSSEVFFHFGDGINPLFFIEPPSQQLTPPNWTVQTSDGYTSNLGASDGGAGSSFNLRAGVGGNGFGTGHIGGIGGNIDITAGNGGRSRTTAPSVPNGGNIVITAGRGGASDDGAPGDGGDITIASGALLNGGEDGNINFNIGTSPFVVFDGENITIDSAVASPRIQQGSIGGAGTNLSILAQSSTLSGNVGGNLILSSGSGSSANDGYLHLQHGVTDSLIITPDGLVNFANATTATSAGNTGGRTLPVNPLDFLEVQVNGVTVKIPYYPV